MVPTAPATTEERSPGSMRRHIGEPFDAERRAYSFPHRGTMNSGHRPYVSDERQGDGWGVVRRVAGELAPRSGDLRAADVWRIETSVEGSRRGRFRLRARRTTATMRGATWW
jgi:hypothetical protein